MDAAAVVVLVVPFPAQGHLNSLLHFSRLLASRCLPVVFFGSEIHNRQAKLRLEGWDLGSYPTISFHDLPLPPFAVPDPDSESTNKFPSHLQPCFDVLEQLRDPLDALVRKFSASSGRVVIVHDNLMSFAADIGSKYGNVDSVAFCCISVLSALFHQMHRGKEKAEGIESVLDPIPVEECYTEEFYKYAYRATRFVPLTKGHLFNTFGAMEGKFITTLSKSPQYEKRKMWSMGPLIPLPLENASRPKSFLFDWLDKQQDRSVLYVSFGSNSSLSSAQIAELASGLERSRQRFLWVLRTADRGDVFAEESDHQIQLPDGFEQQNRSRESEW